MSLDGLLLPSTLYMYINLLLTVVDVDEKLIVAVPKSASASNVIISSGEVLVLNAVAFAGVYTNYLYYVSSSPFCFTT